MGKTAIGYGNLTDSATISSSNGWQSGQPLSNVQDRELAIYAQTDYVSTLDIIYDHTTAEVAQCFGVFAHSITNPAATIRVTRGTTSGGSDVYDSGTLACWPFTPLEYDGGHFGLFVIAGAPSTARYTKIEIAYVDAGYKRIGRTFVGPMIVPYYNPEYGNSTDGWRDVASSVERAESGADWVTQRTELRSATFNMPAMARSDGKGSLLHEIMRTHSIAKEVVYVRDTEDRDRQQQFGFLGIMRSLSALENPHYLYNSAALAIDERGGAP